jgi:hypothetical protein
MARKLTLRAILATVVFIGLVSVVLEQRAAALCPGGYCCEALIWEVNGLTVTTRNGCQSTGNPFSLVHDWGDGTVYYDTQSGDIGIHYYTHTYSAAGTYTITWTTYDVNGTPCQDTNTVTVN